VKSFAESAAKPKERSMIRNAVVLAVTVAVLLSLAAMAQDEQRAEVSLQGMAFFTKSASNVNGTSYSATQSGGVLGTFRYHFGPRISAELAYGFARNTQKYSLGSQAFRIQSNVNQVTLAMVANLGHPKKFTPYMLVGAGVVVFAPSGNQLNFVSGAQTQGKGAFVYGVGVNYPLQKNFSFRAEYRGLLYGPPTFGFGGLSTNSITHSAEPSIGVSYRF
jgi:outer membrane autotransporter protein